MKIALLIICYTLDILTTQIVCTSHGKPAPIVSSDTEAEENDQNISTYLEDLLYKALDSNEDYSVSLISKHSAPKLVIPKINKKNKPQIPKVKSNKKSKELKQHKKHRRILGQVSYPNSIETDIQTRLKREAIEQKIDTDMKNTIRQDAKTNSEESSDSHDGKLNEPIKRRAKLIKHAARTSSLKKRDDDYDDDNDVEFGGSIEDETLEEEGELDRREEPEKRRFEDVYRYENEPLKNMLLWLVINSQNPLIKNAIKSSKTSVDKYVKHTVDKAGTQAALRYTDYTSVRFDKDRIIMYCGGQMFVYNTMKDSKICFNGQIYEVRLI